MLALVGLRPGVGKSTASRWLQSDLQFEEVSIGDAVKAELDGMLRVHGLRYTEERKESFRPLLSAWTEFRLSHDPRHWIASMEQRVVAASRDVVVSDVRYLDEVEAVRALGGLVVLIERSGAGPNDCLASETALRVGFTPDHVIDNTRDDGGARMVDQLAAIVRSMRGT